MTEATKFYVSPNPNTCRIPDPIPEVYWIRDLVEDKTHIWSRTDDARWEMTLIFKSFEMGTKKCLGGWQLFEAEDDANPNDSSWASKYNSALSAFIEHGFCFEAWDGGSNAPPQNE
ncbi:hypothetical protein ST47_g71 [Ascochyta rabiei]|uniref:Uncharacterized protein n=1 Tax=Didymella rabiei TaxID=5454 RepID=A0A163MK09_DIDRA|nr:hypothetical protein ST47_g71 [Ascochyta rabiei]